LPDCIHNIFRFFLEVLYGLADSGPKFRELSPPEKQYDYEQNQQNLAYSETVHSVLPPYFSLPSEQVFDFIDELKEFLRLPVLVERLLMLEPALPYRHPRGVMPVAVRVSPVSTDPGAVFFVLQPAGLAETVWSGKLGEFFGLGVYLGPTLRALHHTPGTLKDLPQRFDLAPAHSVVALRPQALDFFAEFDDVGHIASFLGGFEKGLILRIFAFSRRCILFTRFFDQIEKLLGQIHVNGLGVSLRLLF